MIPKTDYLITPSSDAYFLPHNIKKNEIKDKTCKLTIFRTKLNLGYYIKLQIWYRFKPLDGDSKKKKNTTTGYNVYNDLKTPSLALIILTKSIPKVQLLFIYIKIQIPKCNYIGFGKTSFIKPSTFSSEFQVKYSGYLWEYLTMLSNSFIKNTSSEETSVLA